MTLFLWIGAIGVVLLLLTLVLDDFLDGILDGLGGSEWFTGAALAGFLGALGFGGALVHALTENLTLAWVVGVAAGLGLGAVVGWVTARMRHTDSGLAPGARELVGVTATVATPIPEGGYGTVRLHHGGHLTTMNARSEAPVAAGETVWVVESLSPGAVLVRPTHPTGDPFSPTADRPD